MEILPKFQEIIQYSVKAPSGHNTQPWKFKVLEDEIQIHPDFERALPIVDPDNHALYIGLGCAAENCIIAAKAKGFKPALIIYKSDGVAIISIKMNTDPYQEKDVLVDYIEKRQVVKNGYKDTVVSEEVIGKLKGASVFEGIELYFLNTKKEIEALETFIVQGSNLQFGNEKFVRELLDWLRFSKKEAEREGDGVWNATMGMPGVGRFLGELIIGKMATPKSEAKRWKKLINASAGFVLFTAQENNAKYWINLGRAFQRFALTATQLDLSHAHVNMPCEEVVVRNKMAKHFDLPGHPLLLIRYGYAEDMPYSFRRSVEKVILEG